MTEPGKTAIDAASYPMLAADAAKRRGRYFLTLRGLDNVGIDPAGQLHNPHGLPEEAVCRALEDWLTKRRQRGTAIATRAAATRAKRRQRKVEEAAKRFRTNGGLFGPADRCEICHKKLTDPEAIRVGIGPECWQDVLRQATGPHEVTLSAGKVSLTGLP